MPYAIHPDGAQPSKWPCLVRCPRGNDPNPAAVSPIPPIYKEHGRTYRADTCEPVARAAEAGVIGYSALVRGHYPGKKLPRGVLPGVRNVGFWSVEAPQTWGLDWHRNEGIEITYLERGKLAFAVDHRACQLRAGDVTFTRPWQRHRVGLPNITPSRLHWLILDLGVRRPHQPWHWPSWVVLTKSDRDELTSMLRHAADPVWRADNDVLQCVRRIARAVERDRDGDSASRIAAYLNELFVLLLDILREGRIAFDEKLATSQQTVELFWQDLQRDTRNLTHPWTVREMAERCGLGITQFTRECKRLTNMTPMELLGRRRIEAAERILLAKPEMNITCVALDCGFSSSQYFAKVFRKHFRCSPTEYRHLAHG